MVPDATLVLAWLVLAHLVADFTLQTDRIVAEKGATGRAAMRGLGLHGAGVAICLVPVVVAFGMPGLQLLVVVTLTHIAVDRAKALITRRVEGRARVRAGAAAGDRSVGTSSFGPGWTPMPAFLFVFDQVMHLVILVWAWAVFLSPAVPVEWFAAGVDALLGGWDRAVVHDVTLTAVVILSLLLVNIRAGSLLVAVLVSPPPAMGPSTGTAQPVADGAAMTAGAAPAPSLQGEPGAGWRVRLGPLEATVESATAAPASSVGPALTGPGVAPPARVGATIGILERLLIVTFVLTGSQAAIGFVVAAKTLARFRQLEDRSFAEYYLLGTLASVAVALGSGLVAAAALATIS
jgi:hypothetical protein